MISADVLLAVGALSELCPEVVPTFCKVPSAPPDKEYAQSLHLSP